MEWNQQTVEFLSTNFLNTLSPNPEPRRKSESELSTLSTSPNYALLVLRLVSEPSIDPQIRLAASVNLKNHIKLHWANPDDPAALSDSEKEQIKSLIVPIMLGSTPLIQSQLSEALSIIGKSDFPKRWPGLLPELVLSLGKAKEAGDWVSVNGILSTANTLFKKFRFEYKTNDLLLDLKYCLDNFCEPLLRVFLSNGELIEGVRKTAVGNVGDLRWVKGLFESQRLCCRIFYSLNFQELPEFFEDHMEEWMGEFRKYLVESYPVLEGSEEGVGVVDGVRAAVCENICLYMEKNEEEFQKYLEGFALAVWGLLGSVSQSSSRDRLAITAIKFLTTVSTSVHHGLFAADQVIPQICQNIVIPNVKLRDEDEELFDMNYVEFIRRDMEGSDLDTRRRIACELLKGIATNYKKQVIDIVSAQIQSLLSSFAANPGGNWKDKDCAIYLVVSLATKKAAGNYVTTDIVDVESFFTSVIVPELRSQEVNAVPMLKAGALKFFTMFRYQLSKPVALALLPDVVRYLQSESNVVHSYAASCIEKLLLVKDEGGRARYTSADINPFLLVLMTNLFNALKFPESEENQYVMKCIMRVLGVADISPDIASPCIAQLTSVLGTVCNNPKNPAFNHYLFESVAVLVRRTCEKDASLISAFETSLFPSLQMILTNDVTEFLPYAFQILAQLVELNRSPIPDVYMQIFGLLLSPDLWKRSSNVPALVRLLQAFLQKAPRELNQQGRLNEVLGICQMLVSVSSTDEQGFYILNTIIEYLEFDALSPYVGQIWNVLFQRLQNKKTVKFIKGLLIFMSLFVVKHGSARLVDTIRALQANLIFMILEVIWIPNLKVITGAIEVKLTAVASTKLICETPFLLDAAAVTHWGKMLDSIVTLVSRPEEDRVQEEPDMPDFTENVGYSATFVQLYNAGKKEEDPLKDIKNPKEFLVASLAKLSTLHPGRFPTIINQNLESANQAALLELCKTYNCLIV